MNDIKFNAVISANEQEAFELDQQLVAGGVSSGDVESLSANGYARVLVGFDAMKKAQNDFPDMLVIKKVFRSKSGLPASEPRFIVIDNPTSAFVDSLMPLFENHPYVLGAMVDSITDTTGVLSAMFQDIILNDDGDLLDVKFIHRVRFGLSAINSYLEKVATERAANSGVKLNAAVIDQFFTDNMGGIVRELIKVKNPNAPETTLVKGVEQFTGLFKRLIKGQLANIDSLNALAKLLGHVSLSSNEIAVALKGRVQRAIDNLNSADVNDLI